MENIIRKPRANGIGDARPVGAGRLALEWPDASMDWWIHLLQESLCCKNPLLHSALQSEALYRFWCSQEATLRYGCHHLFFINNSAMGSGLWRHATVHEDRFDEVSAIGPCTGTRANCTPTTSVQQQLWPREDHDPAWFSHSAFPITLAPGVTVSAPYQRDGWSRKNRLGIWSWHLAPFLSHDAVTLQTPQLARFWELS